MSLSQQHLTVDGSLGPDADLLRRAERTLVRSTAACASFCEHVEHNEPSTTHAVVAAAADMRQIAARLAAAGGISLRDAYTSRLRGVEEASLLRFTTGSGHAELAGAQAAAQVYRWDDLQVAQIVHDRQFHPDVFGLSKIDQIRHYTFHVAKLAGLLVDAVDTDQWNRFRDSRLADIAIFGVKLATVCNERLLPTEIDQV